MATKKNISINGNEYYKITRTIGYKYVNGEKVAIKKQFYGTSKANAQKKYENWKEEQLLQKQEEVILNRTRTFNDAVEYYCENILAVKSSYSVGTRELYMRAYRTYIKNSALTAMLLCNIKAEHLQMFYNRLDVSKSTLATIHKFMRGFYKWACSMDYCDNVLNSVIIPEKKIVKKQEKIIVWEDDEIEKIFSVEPDFIYLEILRFAYYTGMRISELLGLKWVDFSDSTITIKRQYYRGTWTPPKNNKERTVPIHENLKEFIETAPKEYDLVFHTAVGTPLDYHNVTKSINAFYKRNGISQKKFHAYRATFCTNLCKNGVPIQIASKLAGHSSISVTAKYYTSVSADEELNAISKL